MQATSSHPTDRHLREYANGLLDAAAAAAVAGHLEECPECSRKAAAISSDGFLDAFRRASPAGRSDVQRQDPARIGSRADREPVESGTSRAARTGSAAEAVPPELATHPDYEVRRELGRGGMGVVYLAHNRLMGRDEVLKVMSRQIIERPGVMDRFLREIRTVAQLRHPNIVTAYAAFRIGESLVFAMEFVDGLDLARTVKARGPMRIENACYYAHQAALGLQHAHERGLVHRDIKPSNLMLSREGERAVVKVLDFGLAKAGRENEVDELALDRGGHGEAFGSALTQDGQMLGTPDFIAPEQIDSALHADIRADIYSLGCTLYYLLSGAPPFRADTLWDVLQAHYSMEAQPLNLARPEVPAELAALVAKMMAKEPGRRFQTPDEVSRALTLYFKRVPRSGQVARLVHAPPVGGDTNLSTGGPSRVATPWLPPPHPDAHPGPPGDPDGPVVVPRSPTGSPEFEEPLPQPEVGTEPPGNRPHRSRSSSAKLVSYLTRADLVALVLLFSVIMYWLATDWGELRIETDDPNAKILVKQAGKVQAIIVPGARDRILLRPGEYELDSWSNGKGLSLSVDHFVLGRGEEKIVSLDRKLRRLPMDPPAPVPPPATVNVQHEYLPEIPEWPFAPFPPIVATAGQTTVYSKPPTPAPDPKTGSEIVEPPAEIGPEELLRSKDLRRSFWTWVHPSETNVLKDLNDARDFYRRYKEAMVRRQELDLVLQERQETLMQLRAQSQGLSRRIAELDKRLASLAIDRGGNTFVAQLDEEISKALREEISKERNEFVRQYNEVVSLMGTYQEQANQLERETALRLQHNVEVAKTRERYMQALLDFRKSADHMRGRYAELASNQEVTKALELLTRRSKTTHRLGPSKAVQDALETLERSEGTVKSESVALTKENGVDHVYATLNRTPVKMVFDTGAGLTTISATLALKVGAKPSADDATIQLKTADGTVVDGKIGIIPTVRVGKFTVKNVACAIMPADNGESDPILGQSFLKYFKVEYQPEAGRLTLKRVEIDADGQATSAEDDPTKAVMKSRRPGRQARPPAGKHATRHRQDGSSVPEPRP